MADAVEISDTPMITPRGDSNASDFISDLGEGEPQISPFDRAAEPVETGNPANGDTSGDADGVGSSASETAVFTRAAAEAVEAVDGAEEAATSAVEAAAEAVAEAADSRREEAEAATDVLAEASEAVAKQAEQSAESGDVERALVAADGALALASAAEEAAVIAFEAAVVQEVAEEIAENPEAHSAASIPSIPGRSCPETYSEANPLRIAEAISVLSMESLEEKLADGCTHAIVPEVSQAAVGFGLAGSLQEMFVGDPSHRLAFGTEVHPPSLSGLLVHVAGGDPPVGKVERELDDLLRDLQDD